jgi:hypothetical protein
MAGKGSPKGVRQGGRKPGTPNKLTGEVKAMILEALEQAGGVAYLASQAVETPAAFLSLVGKVLPLQLTGDKDNPVVTRVENVILDHDKA